MSESRYLGPPPLSSAGTGPASGQFLQALQALVQAYNGQTSVLSKVVDQALGSVGWVGVPAHNNSTGAPGQVAYDGSYLYVCVATDTWKRTNIGGTW